MTSHSVDREDDAGAPQYNGLKWAACPGAGDYPILLVDFMGKSADDGDHFRRMFFDTGARHNWISDRLLDSLGIDYISKYFGQFKGTVGLPSQHPRQEPIYSYYSEATLTVTVSDGQSTFSDDVLFRVVRGWNTSTIMTYCSYGICEGSIKSGRKSFECGYREGLLSAAMLRQAGISANVDGRHLTVKLAK